MVKVYKYTKIVILIYFIFILIFNKSSRTEEIGSEIENLKKQIIEIQIQNKKMIEEMERRNHIQIQELKSKIESLELERNADKDDIQYLKDTNTDRNQIEEMISAKMQPLNNFLPKFKFNTDFPSYFRTRGRVFNDATYVGAVPGEDDDIFFVDSRLLISPMFEINENLSLRSQIDIARNIVWGGIGDDSIAENFTEAPSPADSYRGAILRDVTDTFSGDVLSTLDEDIDFFDIRSLYFVAKMSIGELWVGRQPYDWGLGALVNAGSMPDQDFGSLVDRFEFDTAPLSLLDEKWKNWIFAFSIDRLSQGRTIANGADGKGWEIGFGTLYHGANLELGAYVFLLNQNGFNVSGGLSGDLDNTVNWSLYGKYDANRFYVSFEFQDLIGKVNNLDEPLPGIIGDDEIDITSENFMIVARVGYDPKPYFIDYLVMEFGWASGDDTNTQNELEGSAIFFNNAFTVDNLLFKHMIPNIYAIEGSVINSGYVRTWSTIKISNSIYFTPQALFAWVDETNALSLDVITPLPSVNRYLGAELEGTLTYKIMDHLWFDLIGSLVITGDGLDDLLSQRAFIEGAVESISDADPPNYPFAIQGRFIFTLDSIIRSWAGSSTLKERWY